MKQHDHKTEGVNRTKNMRFYPFVFTGKEKDAETGYGYFGARYMDHELKEGLRQWVLEHIDENVGKGYIQHFDLV